MTFVSNLLANNFVANKIGSHLSLFHDDTEDGAESGPAAAARATGTGSYREALHYLYANKYDPNP